MRILDAHGGALYVADRTGGRLMPGFISKGCPPLVDVPQDILQQSAANPITLETFLRLHMVSANEGLIGRILANRSACLYQRILGSAGVGQIARKRFWQRVGRGHGAPVWRPEPRCFRRSPTVQWVPPFRRLILSFLNPSPSNRLSRSTTRSFIRWRTKKSGWITTSKSRETFSASCSHLKRRPSIVELRLRVGLGLLARVLTAGADLDPRLLGERRGGAVLVGAVILVEVDAAPSTSSSMSSSSSSSSSSTTSSASSSPSAPSSPRPRRRARRRRSARPPRRPHAPRPR